MKTAWIMVWNPRRPRADGENPCREISVEIGKAAQKVFVAFRDDGRGLNRDQILQKAKEKGLLKKPESEYEDSEIYAFLLRPGFTTKASATMFSGRGLVWMW